MINNLYDINTESFFAIFNHYINKRTQYLSCLSRSSFYSVRVINDWKTLPQTVIDANSPNQFKNLLDSHYSNITYNF